MKRGRTQKYSDEFLIEWMTSGKSKKELREENIVLYNTANKRGLIHHMPIVTRQQYTDEELIEWIKQFKTIGDMRNDNLSKYTLCTKRKLHQHFPKKRTKAGNTVGSNIEMNKKLKEERNALREEKKRLKEEAKLEKRIQMYSGTKLDNGNIICGRCLEEKVKSKWSATLCKSCYNVYITSKQFNKDHNKWNVRDEFCNTIIRHHDKTFEIGIKVDEKTQSYLTKIGYDFIFKEVYDN